MDIIGVVLDKKYIVDKHIGGGAMGQVFLGRRKSDLLPVAIKVMNRDKASNKKYKARFDYEIKVQCKLKHPNVVEGYDSGEFDGCPYLIMEYIDGPSLDQLLEKQGYLKPKEALKIIYHITLGLDAMVADGTLKAHRDIKPQNVMLAPDDRAKITDFGIAKLYETDNALTRTNTNMGTPYYMSPEQISDPRAADVRSDIYAVGAVFYELLTGKKAFPGETTKAIWDAHFELEPPNISGSDPLVAPINSILDRSMAFDASNRFQSPAELAAEIVPLVDEETIIDRRMFPRATVQLIAALFIVLFLVVGGVALTLRFLPATPSISQGEEPSPEQLGGGSAGPTITIDLGGNNSGSNLDPGGSGPVDTKGTGSKPVDNASNIENRNLSGQ